MVIKRVKSLEKFVKVSERMTGPRVLVGDIETFPLLVYVWGLYKQAIPLDRVHTDWSLMSFAVKWLGEPEVFYLDNRSMDDVRDDSNQLAALHYILQHTDMVIAHNGARFDMPKIRARFALGGYEPLPQIQVIDTLNLNRAAFSFTSHKLAYVSEKFADTPKSEHKLYPGFNLWLGCLNNEKAAWNECQDYNITDITSLEESYMKLRGWYQGQPNFGPFISAELYPNSHVCPTCGSDDVRRHGTRKTQVGIYDRYQCNSCGGWSRGRILVANRKERAHILMN